MGQPLTPYESISFELNQFIERRVNERRAMQRESTDRRQPVSERKSSVSDRTAGKAPGNSAADPLKQ